MGRVDGKLLAESQSAGKLRSMGWTLPAEIAADYMLRVYDTRLEEKWFTGLATELGGIDLDGFVVGGDFLTKPHLEDGPAFHSPPIRRWGPAGSGAYHLIVPPRPHLAAWLQRCHHQLAVESPLAVFSVCCIVPRESCPPVLDAAAIRRLAPQAESLLKDPAVELRAFAVGERPPVVRIPATERQLPPSVWERAQLPRNKVLLVLQFKRHSGAPVAPSGGWIRGQLPTSGVSPLELLRLEFMLPQQLARRMLSASPARVWRGLPASCSCQALLPTSCATFSLPMAPFQQSLVFPAPLLCSG